MIVSSVTPRIQAITWAIEVVNDPASVFLDCETTGLGPKAEIVDIAIVGIDGRVLLESLVLPLNPIPIEASNVHGITIGMLDQAKAPMWQDLYERVASVLTRKRVVVYNADFDARMIDQATAPEQFPATYLDWQCALKAYADFDGTLETKRLKRHGRWTTVREPKWHKLSAAAERFGIPPGTHRALADAETCRRVVIAMSEAPL